MARAVTPAKTRKPVAKATPARPVASAKKMPAKKMPPKTAAAPKLGKEELRAQVEKLERANVTLRAKNKEAGQSAKAAAARVAELEIQVEQLEQKAASQTAPAKAAPQKAASRKAAPKKAEPVKAEPAKPEPAKLVSAKPASAKAGKATPARSRRQKSEIDPGDAVPPGVAVEEPEPMDQEARTAKENLEEHLSGD